MENDKKPITKHNRKKVILAFMEKAIGLRFVTYEERFLYAFIDITLFLKIKTIIFVSY
ncbi:hypothetical protein AM1BK_46110 [Neobacillus kokaensis]|uniref:Uncharacterized protein n=1 Tax=Neobacillus kokaensis TaxID=2759023 RepID=A0ABQ3NAY2_9BACI|nr:hypothetical protein AM1BK_46110 [Neobacillus kokaensis]